MSAAKSRQNVGKFYNHIIAIVSFSWSEVLIVFLSYSPPAAVCLQLVEFLWSERTPCGCRGLMNPRNIVDFGAFSFAYIFLSYLIFFPLRISLLHFHARCDKRRLNLGYNLSWFIYVVGFHV